MKKIFLLFALLEFIYVSSYALESLREFFDCEECCLFCINPDLDDEICTTIEDASITLFASEDIHDINGSDFIYFKKTYVHGDDECIEVPWEDDGCVYESEEYCGSESEDSCCEVEELDWGNCSGEMLAETFTEIQKCPVPTPNSNAQDELETIGIVLLAVIVPCLLLSCLVVVANITTAVLFWKFGTKHTENKESSNPPGRNENSTVIILELGNGPNYKDTKANIEAQDPEYTEIVDYITPVDNPGYGMIRNELYAGLVEGELANVILYGELSQLKNQTSGTYSIVNNSIYNARSNLVSQKSSCFVEPPASLPELESDLKCCPFEIKRGELEVGEQFASGHFGVVYRATYHTARGDIPVAVKTLKESANSDTMVSFMREAATLAQFSHPNVLRLIGVITLQQPWMIVTELLKTELRELLPKLRDLPLSAVLPHLLCKFSQEIAAGMEYLSGINFIHRDLAARNVLVAKDMTMRVADFGMSREVASENSYYTSSGGTIPLRWTAPEAVLHKRFSEKSDVWSYGMTLYEIWSLGERPWGDSTNEEIIGALTVGHSPPPPSDCPQALCAVMQECWGADETDRPTFSQLTRLLSGISLPVTTHN